MSRLFQVIPWVLSLLLAVLVIVSGVAFAVTRTQLQATREQLQTTSEQLQATKDQLATSVSQANAKLAEAEAAYKKLAESATKKIEIASQPEAQVRVAFRKGLVASGYVAIFTNQSNSSVAITAEIARPASRQSKRLSLTLDAGRPAEIGELEGWAFVSGDTVTVHQPEHKSLTFRLQ